MNSSRLIIASYELLMDPAKRKMYDAVYNDITQAVKRQGAQRRATRGIDSKKTIAKNLRLDQPTTFQDRSPVRDHCVVRVAGLPPQVTTFDFFRAIAEVSPVGRIIDCRLMSPSQVSVDRAAIVEFANDVCAQDFGLLAFNSRLHVLGKTHMALHPHPPPAPGGLAPAAARRHACLEHPRPQGPRVDDGQRRRRVS
ncbi:hypothetical protein F5883DRAFT_14392 [Diaporthe sp. PMI_573]|nr:hypothetical protein F5883DRAFT_14392 [Diaporthaceae sp. PMI_573]